MHFVPSKTNMKKLMTVCLITCLTIMHFRADLNAQMTIRITGIPQYFMPLLDTIFIAGDFNSWNPGATVKSSAWNCCTNYTTSANTTAWTP